MKSHVLKVNGKPVTRKEFERVKISDELLRGATSGRQAYEAGRPGDSIGMSVHPSQIPLMNAELKRHGITGVEYDASKRNNCIITSRKGRARWMPIFGKLVGIQGGLHDNDGGYGDG